MEIISKSLCRLTKCERKRLNYLTIRGGSLLREDVLHAKDALEQYQIFMAIDDQKIVGWAALFPEVLSTDCDFASDNHCLYTYTQIAYRRRGIGQQLVNAASSFADQKGFMPKVFPWDARSENFFKSCDHLGLLVADEVLV